MAELRELQSSFAAAIFDAALPPPGDVTSHTADVTVRRFNVYRNNVFSSLADVLEAYFPVVARLVGVEFFRAMAREFILKHPPRSPILSRLGLAFPDFIKGFEPTSDLPYLCDVARLELMQQRAYHAADRTPMTGADFGGIASETASDIVLELHPSTELLVSPHPVVSIWLTNTVDEDVQPIDIKVGGESALVLRPELAVKVVPVPTATAVFAALLMRGHTIREAAEGSGSVNPELDFTIAMATLIDIGAIVGFTSRQSQCSNPTASTNHDRIDRCLH